MTSLFVVAALTALGCSSAPVDAMRLARSRTSCLSVASNDEISSLIQRKISMGGSWLSICLRPYETCVAASDLLCSPLMDPLQIDDGHQESLAGSACALPALVDMIFSFAVALWHSQVPGNNSAFRDECTRASALKAALHACTRSFYSDCWRFRVPANSVPRETLGRSLLMNSARKALCEVITINVSLSS